VRAFLRSFKSNVKDPSAAVESVIWRDDAAQKEFEPERLKMTLRNNILTILTPETRADGLGGVEGARFDKAIDQTALTCVFRTPPEGVDIFDLSLLPPPPTA
jgi:NitT/TauT family transport system substrate-binding protein